MKEHTRSLFLKDKLISPPRLKSRVRTRLFAFLLLSLLPSPPPPLSAGSTEHR